MKTPRFFEYIRALLFPERCIFCGEAVSAEQNHVCGKCKSSLPYVKQPRCERCGKTKSCCNCSSLGGLWFNFATAPFTYNVQVANAVHMLKFKGLTCATPVAAGYMLDALHEKCGKVLPFDVITFVPMTAKCIRKRGYNQAELLAKCISEQCGIPCEMLISKVLETKPQRTLTEKQRRVNVLGCFDASPKATRQRVLIVDDVMTTGATLNECAKALAFVSVGSVSCVTFATVNLERKKPKVKRGKINSK